MERTRTGGLLAYGVVLAVCAAGPPSERAAHHDPWPAARSTTPLTTWRALAVNRCCSFGAGKRQPSRICVRSTTRSTPSPVSAAVS
jgi:hypothetical protein